MIAAVTLAKGSIETIAIDVADRFANLANLDTASPTYDIETTDAAAVITAHAAQNVGLTALCQIDTTDVLLPKGEYRLFLNFTANTDSPRLGPIVLIIA